MGGKRINWDKILDRLGREPDRALAEEVGCSVAAVRQKRYVLGITQQHEYTRVTSPEIIEAIRERGAKDPSSKLATELGISASVVRRYRKQFGIKVRPGRPSGTVREMKSQPWHEWLGKIPDTQIEARFGVTRQRAQQVRKQLGIPPYGNKLWVDWARWDSLLGTVTERELSQKIGCSICAVRCRRRKLGIDPHGRTLKTYPFDNLLGKQSDLSISRQFDTYLSTVWQRRVALGIPPWRRRAVVDWEKWKPLMGTMSDAELAKQIGCNHMVVAKHRREFGIKSYRRFNFNKWRKLLGTMSDRALAEKIGCSKMTISRHRQKHGIEAFGQQGKRRKNQWVGSYWR